jgi:hypoxanthine phosphoribosyltransferase
MLEEPGDRRRPNLPVLVGEAELGKRVAELAAAITRDHSGDELLVVVAIMKGALVFLADLVRHLAMPLEIELVNARSYVGADREPEVDVISDVAALPVAGRCVLLVDCVLDSGHTLTALRRQIAARSPASLKTCVLLSKDRPRDVAIEPDYTGLEIPDVFVVGYGLDYRNRWRHLPYVAELAPARTSRGDA